MKLKQRDLCVLYLSQKGGWTRAVEMKGKSYGERFLGSESDRRLQEVMEIVRELGYYQVGDYKYVVEEGRDGRYKTYRVINPKPRIEHKLVFKDGRPVRVPVLLNL